MIHHVSVGTNDVERSKRFYDAVLPIVGIHLMAEEEGGLGYGSGTFHFSDISGIPEADTACPLGRLSRNASDAPPTAPLRSIISTWLAHQ